VEVQVLVDESGVVVDARTSGAPIPHGMKPRLLAAARAARFLHATDEDGKKVRVWTTITFQLQVR
jgi:outer membrane biosynthesis protein TonB